MKTVALLLLLAVAAACSPAAPLAFEARQASAFINNLTCRTTVHLDERPAEVARGDAIGWDNGGHPWRQAFVVTSCASADTPLRLRATQPEDLQPGEATLRILELDGALPQLYEVADGTLSIADGEGELRVEIDALVTSQERAGELRFTQSVVVAPALN